VLGETIRRLRYEKVWSVLQLSKRSGVPEHLIFGIESEHPYVYRARPTRCCWVRL
jgi:hypothetical protein